MKKRVIIISAVAAAVIVLAAVSGIVYGRLWGGAGKVENTMAPAVDSDPVIVEETVRDDSGKLLTKSNVTVTVPDAGYSVFVRAAVVVTWKNSSGDVYSVAPVAGTDYDIVFTDKWTLKDDGFYYYPSAVASGGTTDVLITSCAQIKDAPADGYFLSVEILAQTVQSAGTVDTGTTPAVTDAWGTPGTAAPVTPPEAPTVSPEA